MPQEISQKIQLLLKKIPACPGVYLMKDSEDVTIYVGKAKNLKNRLKSYFQLSTSHGVKTEKMVENVENIDWIEVNSETEALVLETNYIKEYRPKYNILMKDDKSFVYLKIDLKEDFPELQIVRQIQKDGAKYFGPKTSKGSLIQTLEFLQKLFPIHHCKSKTLGHPCIEYQMHKSLGPCLGDEYKEAYHHHIKKIIDFFEGNYDLIFKELKAEMMQAAQEKRFEKAAKMRDLVQKIENIQNEQIVSNPDEMKSRDIIGVFHDLGKTFVALFQVRAGKMIHNEQYILINEGSFEEMIQAFITEFYTQAADMPQEILIPKDIEEKIELETWFEASLKTKVKILAPQRGMKNDLVELAMQNAKSFAERERARWMSDKLRKEQAEKDITELINQNAVGVQHSFPKRMECFDISHFQGEAMVASMVVFLNGEESKSEYRRYKLKTLEAREIDDFKSMAEVLGRRLLEIENTLGFQAQEAIPDGFELRKLSKKELTFIPSQVLFLTGPSAAGKTTISNLIAKQFKYKVIHGDEIKESLFGEEKGVWKDEEKMRMICDQIIEKTEEYRKKGYSVIIDYWANQMILDSFKSSFGTSLYIKVLLPKIELALERDQTRGDHIAGEEAIKNLYSFFETLKTDRKIAIIDNFDQNPEETFQKHFSYLKEKPDYYGLFENEEMKNVIEIKKHDAKTLEWLGITPQKVLYDALLEKILFALLFDQFQGKDLWILTEDQEKHESFGFKKLKTLEKGWQEDRGLVPESIAKKSLKETGYAMKIRIPKKEKGNVTLPDFILIDGGKGQLSSVVEVFTEMGWEYKENAFCSHNHKIIVCSLAKREEEVFFPFESDPRILPNTSEGSYLLQRLRDEAHRFAITYNRDSREKIGIKSELDDIDGIGPVTKKKLLKTFGSVAGIKKANFENLKLSVGETTAKTIQEYFARSSL